MVGFTSDADYEAWIVGTLLPRCESIVEDYCGQDFTDSTVSQTVKYVCAMLAAKIIQHIIMNATAPIVKISDYQVQVASLTVFSQDLKDLLGSNVKPRHYTRSTDYRTDDIKEEWEE